MFLGNKKIVKVLCLFLAFNFAIILPNSFFFSQAKAQNSPGPVSPTSNVVNITFTSDRLGIVVKFCSTSCEKPVFQYNFTGVEQINSDQFSSKIQKTKSGRNSVYVYGISSDEGANAYLVVGSVPDSSGASYSHFDGPYWKDGNIYKPLTKEQFQDLANSEGTIPSPASLKTSQSTAEFVNLLNSASTADVLIHVSTKLTTSDVCSKIQADWGQFTGIVKTLISQTPDKNPTMWHYVGPTSGSITATNVVSATTVIAGLLTAPVTLGTSAAGGIGIAAAMQSWKKAWQDYGSGWELTAAGQDQLNQALTLAKDMENNADDIISRTGGNTWPANCAPAILDENWKPTTTTFSTPNDFKNYMSAMSNSLQAIVAAWTQKINAATDDTCGAITYNLITGGLFPWLFCEVAYIIHKVDAWILSTALKYLNTSIGLATGAPVPSVGSGNTSTGDGNSPTPVPIDTQAVDFCKLKKPSYTQTDWDKGPCVSENLNDTGYAIDIAHNPRQAVDDANTCKSPAKWVELDTSCKIIREQN